MRLTRKLGSDAGWAAMKIVTSLARWRGPGYTLALGRALGRLAWLVPGRRKRLSLANAAVALPHLSPRERGRVVREAILDSLAYWPELVSFAYGDPRNVLDAVAVEGGEHLDAALANGRGVVAPSIHLGNFPVLATWMSHAGYDFQFLSRFPHDVRVVRLMAKVRAHVRVSLIRDLPRRQCLVGCRAALGRGGIICSQLDQRAMTGLPGTDVPFFGRPFHAFSGMVSLALKAGAPLVPMYIRRERGIRHRLVIEPEVTADDGAPRKEAVRAVMKNLMRRFEAWVTAHPDQWWWPRRIWVDG